ncbi:MAG: hypothetical protein ACI8W7_003808 [Gammaproteobacteria bacterium]|jgi:hypothetical protein
MKPFGCSEQPKKTYRAGILLFKINWIHIYWLDFCAVSGRFTQAEPGELVLFTAPALGPLNRPKKNSPTFPLAGATVSSLARATTAGLDSGLGFEVGVTRTG